MFAIGLQSTGRLPQELVFDSKLTTYHLNELNKDIDFIMCYRPKHFRHRRCNGYVL